MGNMNDYYDFHCGNDPRLVKIAINNDNFHTITIRANVAKTIDFSGGTRKVETIRLSKCFKTTRIIWPERTGAIRRLYIHHADTLTKLDVSALTSLEELSILNCRSLEEITGLSDSLKEINIHNVKLGALDVSKLKQLQKINLSTSSANIDLDLSSIESVQIAFITTNKSAYKNENVSSFNFQGCHSLHTISVDTGDNVADVDLADCTGLNDLAIISGPSTKLNGLEDCKMLDFFFAENKLEMNESSNRIAKKLLSNNSHQILSDIKKMSKDFYGITKHCNAGIHDRETIIQESGSQVEVDKGNAAVIRLLGMPIDVQMAVNKKDLSKELRQVMIDNTYFPSATLSPLYHLPEFPDSKEYGIPASRTASRENAEKSITAWLDNVEEFTPNLLLLDQNSIQFPEVKKLLDQFTKQSKYVINKDKKYFLRPFDKIIIHGNWYYIKNRLPRLAGIINLIPKSALATPVGAALRSSTNALAHYQHMLTEANAMLAQHMMQNNQSLSNRSRNLQILRQTAEYRRLTQDFFHYLAIAINENQRREREPDHQVHLEGRAQSPQHPGSQPGKQPQVATRKSNDFTPQHEIRYNTPDGQTNIDAEAQSPQQPGKQPDAATRKNNDITPQHEIRYDTPDGQNNIDAEAQSPQHPGSQPGKQPQVATRKSNDFTPQREIRYDTPDGQDNIDAEATAPTDLTPKKALQDPIHVNHQGEGLADVPPLDVDPTNQRLIGVAKKLADAVNDMFKHAYGLPEQILITAGAATPPDLAAKKTLQTPIQVTHQAEGLPGVPPLVAEPSNQKMIVAAKNLAQAVKCMTENTDGLPEQVRIYAEAHSPPDALKNAPKLAVNNNDQQLLSATKGLADEVLAMSQNTPDLLEQILVDASTHSKRGANNQRILSAAEKLALAVQRMVKNVDGLPNQVLLHVEKSHRESPAGNHEKLLESAQLLAEALKKMTDTACALDTEFTSTSAKSASVLVEASIKDLKECHNPSSLFDAAAELIISMKLLAKACNEDLPLAERTSPNTEIAADVRASIFKILTNAHRQYIKDHDLLNPGASLFGRKHGIEEQRAVILERFIDSLVNVATMSHSEVESDFNKLIKDTDLKYALGGIEAEIKECLTGMKHPDPKLNSQQKSKESDE